MPSRAPRVATRGRGAPTFVVEVRGDKGIVTNLFATDKRFRQEVVHTQRKFAKKVTDRAVHYAPFSLPGDYPGAGTYRLKRSLHWYLTEEGMVFIVESDPGLFVEEGFPYYPWWVHEGTSHMPGRPFLRQSYEELKGSYRAEIGNALRRAMMRRTG